MAKLLGTNDLMNKVTIGQRNQLISIQHSVSTKNELGETQNNWQEFAQAWAKVTNKTGGESESGGRVNVTATYWFITGFVPDVDESMRIVWNNKTFNISNVHDPDGTSEVLKITAFLDG